MWNWKAYVLASALFSALGAVAMLLRARLSVMVGVTMWLVALMFIILAVDSRRRKPD